MKKLSLLSNIIIIIAGVGIVVSEFMRESEIYIKLHGISQIALGVGLILLGISVLIKNVGKK